MYLSSEDAMDAAEPVTLSAARAELARHYCRIVDVASDGRIEVTNDLDPPEVIGCDTRSILIWLGY